MQVYKTRSFNEYFSDTIAFFKENGKHFFRNYILINGGFILIIAVLLYFITKLYMETVFSMTTMPGASDTSYIYNYFADNSGLFISLGILLVIVTLFLSLLNLTYPIVYLQLHDRLGVGSFTTNDIIRELKNNLGKMAKFMLGIIFIFLPVFAIVLGILMLLAFILIGIPLMFIAVPAMAAWMSLSYHEYIAGKSGFFDSLGIGFRMLRQQFWTIWGTTVLFLLIVQMLQGAVTLIPYIIGMIIMVSGMSTAPPDQGMFSSMAIFMAGMMVFAIIISYLLNNIVMIAQGLMYFSIREKSERRSTTSVIDEIGSGI